MSSRADNGNRTAEDAMRQKTLIYRRIIERSRVSIDSDSNWLITMSDVMSLLLVFFIMFFFTARATEKDRGLSDMVSPSVLTHGEPQKSKTLLGAPVSTAEDIRGEMESLIRGLNMENEVSVDAVEKEIVITMKESVTFRPAEAEILKGSIPVLERIADIIMRHPSFIVEIDGHTDNVPISTRRYPSNWELSVARAASVLRYFITKHGINPSRFYIKGNADQRPIVPNDTPQQRSRNRRVEIRLKETR